MSLEPGEPAPVPTCPRVLVPPPNAAAGWRGTFPSDTIASLHGHPRKTAMFHGRKTAAERRKNGSCSSFTW
jgi:hypothetical protein